MSLFPENDLPTAKRPTGRRSATVAEAPSSAIPLSQLPLAARMRPRTFNEYTGQKHLTAPNAPLRLAIEADRTPSCLFFGPAGTGKTTLARLCATLTASHFEEFSAITGGVADVRRIIGEARQRRNDTASSTTDSGNTTNGQRTILFVDEIHRFNRAQQDAFLPHVEDGTVTLIGATTENPLASVNTPLLSRCRLFRFEPLNDNDIIQLLQSALTHERGLGNLHIQAEDAALEHIARSSLGDARSALNALEMASDLAVASTHPRQQLPPVKPTAMESAQEDVVSRQHKVDNCIVLSLALVEEAIGRRALDYDKSGDNHYGVISAYIKSLRGGDPDAAIFWMVRMLDSGEDPRFIARRLVIQASEDIGNADPHALPLAIAALTAVEKVGMPEAAIPLAQATIYIASAPKSNASYIALHRARALLAEKPPPAVPVHLRPGSLPGARERLGDGDGYLYPHDFEGHFVSQDYLPPGFKTQLLYEPTGNGYEAKIAARLWRWWGVETDAQADKDSDRIDAGKESDTS
jgi:putative ATPase